MAQGKVAVSSDENQYEYFDNSALVGVFGWKTCYSRRKKCPRVSLSFFFLVVKRPKFTISSPLVGGYNIYDIYLFTFFHFHIMFQSVFHVGP